MDKVFSYNGDIDKTAYMNWRTRQHQPIHDMIIIADGYIKAAIMLAKKDQKKQFKEMTKELEAYIAELYDKIDKDNKKNINL